MPYRLIPGYAMKWKVRWSYEDAVEDNFIAPLRYLAHLTPELLSNAPKQLSATPVGREWPDMIANSSQWVVRPAVKDSIEKLEPHVHTFIPVELLSKKHAAPELFYFLRIGQAIDAVVIEKSEFVEGFGISGFKKSPYLAPAGKTTLRAEQISGKHLWRGGWVSPKGDVVDRFWCDIFCSDALRDAFVHAKFRDCRFIECDVE
ncbi:MAG: hypothetical protein NW223_03285 [Hyphomicrobiaceae bacterium]|nr:hypothetical protein [Hyphomicrobiaceae bacterium]